MADTATFADFYARYARRLHGFVVTVYGHRDADDVTQDAMLRAYAAYGRLDPERDPWPWLTTIARNVARNRHARSAAIPFADLPRPAPESTGEVEERHVVRAALGRLSPADRDVLVLREWHDYSFDELALLLGRSPDTLRQQALRARRRLADAYTALGGRAVGVACWLRRCWPVADVATAVVVAGVLALHGGEPAPRPAPGVAAGPAARTGTHAGPAVGRAAPFRPLQPSGAARSSVPEETPARAGRAAGPAPAAGDADVDAGPANRAQLGLDRRGASVTCALSGACYTIQGTHSRSSTYPSTPSTQVVPPVQITP
jgi:RNA polymerase sigma-70 factor (ECF subfamily)